jgi:hypothetical protein
MIRACTWLLVVLAASPFTAPFSTCDVNTLLGAQSPAMMAAVVTPIVLSSACRLAVAETGDAGSISPVVGRVVLTRDDVLIGSIWPVPVSGRAAVRDRLVFTQDPGALEDPPVQSPVLRL